MNKNVAFFLIVLFSTFSCSKMETDVRVESYSSINFTKFDQRINGQELLLKNDGSLIIAGRGFEGEAIFSNPFVLEFNEEEISWISYLPQNSEYLASEMSLNLTPDDNYLFLVNSENSNQNGESGIDLSLFNEIGDIEWNQKVFEENRNLVSSSLVQLPNGDYIILSEDQQSIVEPNKLHLSKISKQSGLIWSKQIENSSVSISRQLVYYPEEEFIIGLTEGYLGIQNSSVDIHKFDLDGQIIWQKAVAELSTIWVGTAHVIRDRDDNLMISFTKNNNVFLIKMDTDGNILWQKNYGGERSDISSGIIQTSDGNYVLLVNTSSYGNGELDLMLTKVDDDGEIIWEKVYGSSRSDQGTDFTEKPNGDLVVIGNSNEETGSDSQFELFILNTDNEGDPK